MLHDEVGYLLLVESDAFFVVSDALAHHIYGVYEAGLQGCGLHSVGVYHVGDLQLVGALALHLEFLGVHKNHVGALGLCRSIGKTYVP